MKTMIACVVLCGLLWTVSGVSTAQPVSDTTPSPSERAVGAILLDFFLLRPLGLAGTAIGSAIYVVTLPVSLPTRSARHVARHMVIAPAQYTFVRPLGEVEGLTTETNP